MEIPKCIYPIEDLVFIDLPKKLNSLIFRFRQVSSWHMNFQQQ